MIIIVERPMMTVGSIGLQSDNWDGRNSIKFYLFDSWIDFKKRDVDTIESNIDFLNKHIRCLNWMGSGVCAKQNNRIKFAKRFNI